MKLVSKKYSSLDERKEVLKELKKEYGCIKLELTLTRKSAAIQHGHLTQTVHSFLNKDNENEIVIDEEIMLNGPEKSFYLIDCANLYADSIIMMLLKRFDNNDTILFLQDTNMIGISEEGSIIGLINALGGEMDYINTMELV